MGDIIIEGEKPLRNYTSRQLGLLREEIAPETNGEWEYIQEHSSDVIPVKPLSPSEFYGVDIQKMHKAFEDAGEPTKGAK